MAMPAQKIPDLQDASRKRSFEQYPPSSGNHGPTKLRKTSEMGDKSQSIQRQQALYTSIKAMPKDMIEKLLYRVAMGNPYLRSVIEDPSTYLRETEAGNVVQQVKLLSSFSQIAPSETPKAPLVPEVVQIPIPKVVVKPRLQKPVKPFDFKKYSAKVETAMNNSVSSPKCEDVIHKSIELIRENAPVGCSSAAKSQALEALGDIAESILNADPSSKAKEIRNSGSPDAVTKAMVVIASDMSRTERAEFLIQSQCMTIILELERDYECYFQEPKLSVLLDLFRSPRAL